ncbi:MAG: potassium-transporting ATPase subunit KdpC [Sphingopyxis sp.]
MFAEIRSALRPAIVMLAMFTLLLGIAYPLVITGVAQLVLPAQAGGSLISGGGHITGSALIGQSFTQDRYVHGRPSTAGAGYDASASAASNLAPNAKDLADRISGDVASLRASGLTGNIPTDLVTTSASGLDPDISPEAALVQAARIAAARGMDAVRVRQVVKDATDYPLFGLIGEPRVNVLQLNRQLDALSANTVQ